MDFVPQGRLYVYVNIGGGIALNGNPFQSYGASPAVWDPTQVNVPCLNPSQIGRYSIYLPRRDGRLS